jgi:cellulose synthase/poly-beta-1,6-N-acetylglucosamine synthase-like glycosyltransferase
MLVIEIIFFIYFLYVVAYALLLSAAGRFLSPLQYGQNQVKASVAVFIPAYKEDGVIYSVAKDALNQAYPPDKFEIIVIADSLKPATITKLKSLPIRVIEVTFEKSTKVKALNAAMAQLPDNRFDLGLILDADNLMEPCFLEKINAAYQEGFQAIQGNRVAKNKNTTFAFLDALSEAINNHIFRRGTYALGGAPSLVGSGMAFHYPILKNTLAGMDSVGGFDREMELLLLEQGAPFCYLANARVLDEKVEKPEVFQNQRKRWISSQFKYVKKYFRKGVKAMLQGNWAYANSSLLRNIQLPRLLNLGLLFFLCLAASLLHQYIFIPASFWWALFAFNALAFILAIPKEFYTKDLLWAILSLPRAFGIMLLLLFKLKDADKKFIHTPHSHPENSAS